MSTIERVARSELATVIIAVLTMTVPALSLFLITPLGSISSTCGGGVITIILACLWRRWQTPVLQDRQPNRSKLHPLIPIALLVTSAFLVAMATNSLAQTVEKAHDGKTEQAISNTPVALIILTVIIVAPIAEELVFRGMIHNHLRGRSIILATITSSTLFGMSHGNLTQIIGGIMLGLILSCVYEMTGTLIGSIAAHMGYNFLILLAPGFGGSAASTSIVLGIAGAVTISSVVYLLNTKRTTLQGEGQ